jgi:transposase-like protein
MGKHHNPLQKEFLIQKYKNNMKIKLADFCDANGVSTTAFKKWLSQYEEGGLEGLARADASIQEVLPEGVDRTVENYKREIIKLRIENERLKKNYSVRTNAAGDLEYIRLKEKTTK